MVLYKSLKNLLETISAIKNLNFELHEDRTLKIVLLRVPLNNKNKCFGHQSETNNPPT